MIDNTGNLYLDGKLVYPNTIAKAVKYKDAEGNFQNLEKVILDFENFKKNLDSLGSNSINGNTTWGDLETK